MSHDLRKLPFRHKPVWMLELECKIANAQEAIRKYQPALDVPEEREIAMAEMARWEAYLRHLQAEYARKTGQGQLNLFGDGDE